MISFQCPHCDKPLIMRNALEGAAMPCPGCGQGVTVPQAPPRRRRPPWLGTVGLLLVVAAVFGVWALHVGRPARVRLRMAERLHEMSQRWQGTVWETCNVESGEYRFTAHYAAEPIPYDLELQRLPGADRSFVRINPDRTGWLALVRIHDGAVAEVLYKGDDPAEKVALGDLAQDLDRALREAIR